jgi:hypothetical protein
MAYSPFDQEAAAHARAARFRAAAGDDAGPVAIATLLAQDGVGDPQGGQACANAAPRHPLTPTQLQGTTACFAAERPSRLAMI